MRKCRPGGSWRIDFAEAHDDAELVGVHPKGEGIEADDGREDDRGNKKTIEPGRPEPPGITCLSLSWPRLSSCSSSGALCESLRLRPPPPLSQGIELSSLSLHEARSADRRLASAISCQVGKLLLCEKSAPTNAGTWFDASAHLTTSSMTPGRAT